MARRCGAVLALYLWALTATRIGAERLVNPAELLSEDDLEEPEAAPAPPRHVPSDQEAALIAVSGHEAKSELGGGLFRYEMLRLEEEAFFERKSLCEVNRGRDAENPTKNDLVARALDVNLDTVKVVSIGSTSTQAYTCAHYIQGFWTGTQPESLRNVNELPRLARWLAHSTTVGEHVYLIGGPGWRIPDSETARSMAPQVWPYPNADMTACGWKPGKTSPPLPKGENFVTADVADGLIGLYQEALCRASCKATVHLVDKAHDQFKRYQLNNGWVDAIKVTEGFTDFKTIVDWGGSGPKPLGAREPLAFDGVIYNNNYLVDQGENNSPDRLNCNKLKKALGDVMTWLSANKEGPYLIAQTGYAREKWTKGLTVQYIKDGKLVELGQEKNAGVRTVLDEPCDFAIKIGKESVKMPLFAARQKKFLTQDITDWVARGTALGAPSSP